MKIEEEGKQRKKLTPVKVVMYSGLIFWTIIQLFPLYWLFTFSLKSNAEILEGISSDFRRNGIGSIMLQYSDRHIFISI